MLKLAPTVIAMLVKLLVSYRLLQRPIGNGEIDSQEKLMFCILAQWMLAR